MKIVCKKYKNWDAKTKRILMGLTNHHMGYTSMMRDNKNNPDVKTYICFNNDEEIIGWSMVGPIINICRLSDGFYNENFVLIYIKKSFRRIGIGKNLLSYICKRHKKILGFKYNLSSKCFYEKINKSLPIVNRCIRCKKFIKCDCFTNEGFETYENSL